MNIVELNATDRAAADSCALKRNHMALLPDGDDSFYGRAEALRAYETALHFNTLGAQGEIAFAKLVGVTGFEPSVGTFRSQADVPPNWNVKTQQSASKDMLRGYLRLRPRDFHVGYRHVLVERALALDGRYLFVVHGWISDDDARSVARQLYSNSPNRFVAVRRLAPIEPLCDLDIAYWQDVAERNGHP